MLFLELINPPDAPLVTTGTSAAYAITPTVPITAYTGGHKWVIKPHVTCADNPTLQVSGVATPPSLVKRNPDGTVSNLAAGDLQSGWVTEVIMLSATQVLVDSCTPAEIKKLMQLNSGVAYLTGGTSSAFTLTPSPALGANVENAEFDVEFHTACASSPTLAVSGLASGQLRFTANEGAIAANAIPSGWRSRVTFDGVYWILRDRPSTAGKLIVFAGSSAPPGYLACPTVPTNISRTTYADLFAAIGTLWGAGDGSTTFGMPYLAANHTILQASGNVGSVYSGQMPSHTHNIYADPYDSGTLANVRMTASINYGSGVTLSAGSGSENLAAGRRFLLCVKY